MNKPAILNYYFEWSRQFPHIAAADLGKGIAYEIAVMAIDNRNGDLYFIRLDQLDPIDIKRLRGIILSRDSQNYALWDLMSNKTLPNGMNALEFFQQLVRVRTANGQIIKPGEGARGVAVNSEFAYKGPASQGYNVSAGNVATSETEVDASADYDDVGNDFESAEQSVPVAVPARRKAGRPPKAK